MSPNDYSSPGIRKSDLEDDDSDDEEASEQIILDDADLKTLHHLVSKYGKDAVLEALPKGKDGRPRLSNRAHHKKVEFFEFINGIIELEGCTQDKALEQYYYMHKIANRPYNELENDDDIGSKPADFSDIPPPTLEQIDALKRQFYEGRKDFARIIEAEQRRLGVWKSTPG